MFSRFFQHAQQFRIRFPTVRDHDFAILFNILLLLLMFFFRAPLQAFGVYFIFLFLPGYLISYLLFRDSLYRTVFSFPIGLVLCGTVVFFSSYFISDAVSWQSGLLCLLIAVVIRWRSSSSNNSLPVLVGKERLFVGVVLLLGIIIAFNTHTVIVNKGSYANDYPVNVIGYDKVIQLTWVRWIALTGFTSLSPALHNGEENIQSGYFPPISIFVPGFFARYSGLSFWDAQNLFSCLIFIFTILGLFGLIAYYFGPGVGFLSAIALTQPIVAFFGADLSGMYRVTMALLLAIFIFLLFELCLSRTKHANYLLGFILGGYFLTQPVSTIVFLIPLACVCITIWQSKNFSKDILYFTPIFIAIVLFLPYFLNASLIYGVDILNINSFSLINPLVFDLRVMELVGPVLILANYWMYLVLSTLVLAHIFYKLLDGKNEFTFSNKIGRYFFIALFLILFSAGLTFFYYHYASKARFLVYVIFFIPLIVFGLMKLLNRFLHISHFYQWIVLLLLFTLLTNPLDTPSLNFIERIDRTAWNALGWIDRETPPSSKVLAIFGFYQSTYLLGNLPGSYVGESKNFLSYLNGAPLTFPLFCIKGFTQEGISPQLADCKSPISDVNENDYVLADYLATSNNPIVIKKTEDALSKWGFASVYSMGEIVIYGRQG